MYGQVADFLAVSGGRAAKLGREQKGRFVSLCWIAQIHRHFPDPKPSYVADWSEQPQWQRETNADIFEAVEAAERVEAVEGAETVDAPLG